MTTWRAWVASGLLLGGLVGSGCQDEPSAEARPDLLVDRDFKVLAFEDPQERCVECHAEHVAQWEISNHAYAAVDPVFHAMVKVGQRATSGKLGQFCVQCHTPPGMAMGQTPVVQDPATGEWTQDLTKLPSLARQGVSCDVCHSVTEVVEPLNARAVLTPDGTRRATIKDPVPTTAHDSAWSELHGTSDVCGMCHAVTNPKGSLVEETFPEWAESSAAKEGKTCQTCHMPEYRGKAAPDGPERTLHRHTFVGVDVSLLPPEAFPGYEELRGLTEQLLRESVAFGAAMDPDTMNLEFTVENLAGHALPSGATAERQMWIEVVVTDESGEVVFESGTLDARGDLRTGLAEQTLEPGSDPQLVMYGQLLIDVPGLHQASEHAQASIRAAVERECLPMGLGGVSRRNGIRPVDFPWEANWQCNAMIRPDGVDRPVYELPPLPRGKYVAHTRLLFRTFPPYFMRKLEKLGGLDPDVKERVPTVVMAEQRVPFVVEVAP